ncbi:exodeoxyribonuclease V subunit gamma [Ignatzschineria sp. LJL83]
MSFHLYYSNHLDTLQYIAGYITKVDPQESPFDKEYFLVQNFGMARWMQIKLAKQLGILTQAEFLLPSKMLMNLLEMIFTEEERAEKPIERLSKDQLFWPLVQIIEEIVSPKEDSDIFGEDPTFFAPIRNYLSQYEQDNVSKQSQNPLIGIMHLAEELASIFDKYIVYRSQWINAWNDQKLSPLHFDQSLPIELEYWQAALFRKVYDKLGRPLHFGLLHPLIAEKLEDPTISQKLPKRIFIIGLNSLPPLFLDLIAQFSKVMDIHLFFNNPSQYYWGDLTKNAGMPSFSLTNFFEQTESQINPISPHIPASMLHSLSAEWQNSYGNPLLASLGKVGRDHLHLLQKYDGDLDLQITEAFAEPEVNSLLQHLQREIYHLRPARESETYVVAENDRSIQLHQTYSPMREVEALYDQILHQLENNPDLAPEDIVVMTPNIEAYAPFIHTVFGSAPENRYLPYSISDVSIKESETIFTTLMQLLALPESAFKASDLLLMLQMPEIMEKFHFEEEDLALIHFWVHDANIKQAIDGMHLTDELQTPYLEYFDWDINTWRWGLQRMLLGYGSEDSALTFPMMNQDNAYHKDPRHVYSHYSTDYIVSPYPYIEGKNALILGNLCHFIDCLIDTKTLLSGDKTITEWELILPKVWQDFFSETSDNNDKLHYTQKMWLGILEGANEIEFSQKIPLKALTPMLENKLLEEKPEQNFIQGKITFCSFIPMRTIPFKMIAMIGMNQADFPKSTIHHSFDLIQYQPMRGDRNRNTDDRYLFLEALLSAKETLYLSYIGKSIRDNSDLYPSLLIDELMRYIDQVSLPESSLHTSSLHEEEESPAKTSTQITSLHPMASYNAMLFSPASAIQSFQDEWLLNAEMIEAYSAPYSYDSLIENFQAQEKITPLTDISLHALIRFYQDPCRYFAENRLNLTTFRDQTNLIEDDEPFIISKGLDEYQFHQALVHALLQEFSRNQHEALRDRSIKTSALKDHFDTPFKVPVDVNTLDKNNIHEDQDDNDDIHHILEKLSKSLFEKYRLQGALPKFAFGELAWKEKSLFAIELVKQLITADYPYGKADTVTFKDGITLYGEVPEASPFGDLILWDVGSLKHDRQLKGAIINLFYHATKTEESAQKTVWLLGKYQHHQDSLVNKVTYPYYRKEEATAILAHLIKGYLYGIQGPIPYFYDATSQGSPKEAFDNAEFQTTCIDIRLKNEDLFAFTKENWNPELFKEILNSENIINSLSQTTRMNLNKVKSLLSGSNSSKRLFPQYGEKEVFAYILFHHHYLNELMSYEE